eukprot:TRINITY_DN17650_c0_g2_i1.p1 TRINITY_DN17650_c0_g2~~TRINITY_DN17650_c0_g2_i1.p1  ORF type:complete len:315 (-),score=9.91 TRINITY_DN17650_c0_g2_i1:118-1062(-)
MKFVTPNQDMILACPLQKSGTFLKCFNYASYVCRIDAEKDEATKSHGAKRICSITNTNHVALITAKDNIRIWDIQEKQEVWTLSGRFVNMLAVPETGMLLTLYHGNQSLVLWDVKQREIVQKFNSPYHQISSLVYDEERQSFLGGSRDGWLHEWMVNFNRSETLINSHEPCGAFAIAEMLEIKGIAKISSIKNSRRLAIEINLGFLTTFCLQSKKRVKRVRGHDREAYGDEVRNQANGLWSVGKGRESFLSGRDDTCCRLWRASNGKMIKSFYTDWWKIRDFILVKIDDKMVLVIVGHTSRVKTFHLCSSKTYF